MRQTYSSFSCVITKFVASLTPMLVWPLFAEDPRVVVDSVGSIRKQNLHTSYLILFSTLEGTGTRMLVPLHHLIHGLPI